MNYKHIFFGKNETGTYTDEFETEMLNKEQLIKILDAINIEYILTVNKKRKLYKFYNSFEVALDYIKDLGYFIEIEVIDRDKTVTELNSMLMSIVKELKLDASKRDKDGYANLFYKKNIKKQL